MLQTMGWQRVRHDLVTEQQQEQSIEGAGGWSSGWRWTERKIWIPKKKNQRRKRTIEASRWYSRNVAAAKSLQSCPTLCDPIDGSPPGSPVPGILQARILEWVAISFSNAWKWKVKVKSLSHIQLFATPWTAAYQAPPSMGFSRQEYWSGVPLPWGQMQESILSQKKKKARDEHMPFASAEKSEPMPKTWGGTKLGRQAWRKAEQRKYRQL